MISKVRSEQQDEKKPIKLARKRLLSVICWLYQERKRQKMIMIGTTGREKTPIKW